MGNRGIYASNTKTSIFNLGEKKLKDLSRINSLSNIKKNVYPEGQL